MWRERMMSNQEKNPPNYNFRIADPLECSFHDISSFTSAVCRMTLCARPSRRPSPCRSAWGNSLIIIFLWRWASAQSSTESKLSSSFEFAFVFAGCCFSPFFEIIFHDTHEYCMRWVFHVICFLLLVQPAGHRNLPGSTRIGGGGGRKEKGKDEKGSQTMKFILYDGIRFIGVAFDEALTHSRGWICFRAMIIRFHYINVIDDLGPRKALRRWRWRWPE